MTFFLCKHFNIWRGSHCTQEQEQTQLAAGENKSAISSFNWRNAGGAPNLESYWKYGNCMSWCSWNDGKLKTEFLQITCNVEHQQVLQVPWPVSICTGSGHSTGFFPVHGPGVAPLTSTQGCAEPTAPSAQECCQPCLLLPAPHHHHLQPFRTKAVQCSPGGGEFEQVQKAHEHLARDLHKTLCQNTARRGRRERKIKGADTTQFKMTD